MRAYVDVKAFSEALKNVSGVLQRSGIPVLEGLLVRFGDGLCTLTGTDMTTWLSVRLPARGDDFSFVLQKPQAAVKACRYFDGELALEPCGNEEKFLKVTFACGKRAGEFEVFPAKDYPEWPQKKESVSFTANAAGLLERVERVRYAVRAPSGCSDQAQRTCVQFNGNDVFCLDGCRAACDTDTALRFPRPFLTWGKSLAFLKLMGGAEVSAEVDERHIWFSTDGVTLCCHNEGVDTFALAKVVPPSFREEFLVSPDKFLRELKYMKGFIQSRRTGTVRFYNGKMDLTDTPTRCCTEVEIIGCGELTVGFSLRYMEDAMKQFKGEPLVKMKLSSNSGPIIIEAENRNDFALVLPVRLANKAAA